MKHLKYLSLLLIVLALNACYHAKVTTEAKPSAETYEKPFASSWINGLVPPQEVNAAEECANGIAKVETKLSFVNMLVGVVTFGIYTPMNIKVTCAASGSASADILIPKKSTQKEVEDAFSKASEKTVSSRKPVYVKFE